MRFILNYLGTTIRLSSIFLIVPIIFGIVTKESVLLYVLTLILLFMVGSGLKILSNILIFTGEEEEQSLSMLGAMTLTVLSYCSVAIMTSFLYFPYIEGSLLIRLTDSLFESVSGFTTTGLTIIPTISVLPKSLILWRSLTQWVGGIGIITFFTIITKILQFNPQYTSNRVKYLKFA